MLEEVLQAFEVSVQPMCGVYTLHILAIPYKGRIIG